MQVLDARRKATAPPRSDRRDTLAAPELSVSRFPGSAGRTVVLYDGRCPMCRRSVRLIAGPIRRRGVAIQPLQRRWVRTMLGVPEAQLLGQMRFVLPDGTMVGGADALLEIARLIWWAFPVRIAARIPGGMATMRRLYAAVAGLRYRWSGEPRRSASLTCRSMCAPAVQGHQSLEPRGHVHAKRRMIEVERGGVFRSDWLRAVFMHFEVDPERLAAAIPYELDLHGGRAYVSAVAFLMRGFRPRGTGALGKAAFATVARHGLLNLRTYVRHRGETGIYFITEWINNRLSVAIGPPLFGLPYRFGRLDYRHAHELGELSGEAADSSEAHRLTYRAGLDGDVPFEPVRGGTLDEFLLERYTAFTMMRGRRSLFRIWHEPWRQRALDVAISNDSLPNSAGEWFKTARLVGGHYSPGVRDVWIGRPRRA